MSDENKYRMLTNGLVGRIKKTEIVTELHRDIGISYVQKVGSDITDYVLPDDRVLIKDEEVPQ